MTMRFASWSFHPLKNRIKSLACIWNICLHWSGFSCICVLNSGTEMRASKRPKFRVSPQCAHLPFRDTVAVVELAVHVFPVLVVLHANSALDALSPALLLKQGASQEVKDLAFLCPL